MATPGGSSLLLALASFALVVAACGGSSAPAATSDGPPADVLLLAGLGRLAAQRVHGTAPGAALQQVDVVPGEGRYVFRFLDPSFSRVVSAAGMAGVTSAEAFTVTVEGMESLTPASVALDLNVLRLGADGVVAVMVRELGAATPRTLTLSRQGEHLIWRVEVNGPKGIVRGTVTDASGAFVRGASTP